MPRASLYLNKQNAELLELTSKLTGKPKARILAEALDQYMSLQKKLVAKKRVLDELHTLTGSWEENHEERNEADVSRP